MKKILFIILLLTPFLFTQCKSSKSGSNDTTSSAKTGVEFVNSTTLTAVLEQAELENKLVFVDLYATWCQPCKLMDKEVFPDKRIAKFFNKNFINYKVDGEKGNGPNIAALYDVRAYPTLLWLDARGRVVERTEGGTFHTELMDLAERALANTGQ